MYKANPDIEEKHIQLMVDDLNFFNTTGVEVNGVRWYACVVGSKGDFKHQALVGNLDRSYHTIGRTYGNLMCSFCIAGAPGYPMEQIDHEPLWARTLHGSRPWSTTPTISLLNYDDLKLET
jgi:hypothetical protein